MIIPGLSLPRRVVFAAVWKPSFLGAEKPRKVKTHIASRLIPLHLIIITCEGPRGVS